MIGRVQEIWRYPVKSMQGERLAEAAVSELGIDGDRRLALRDVASGKLVSAKQNRDILGAGATLVDGRATIRLPDSREIADDDSEIDAVLSQWLGRDVVLERAGPDTSGVYDFYADPEDETSEVIEFWTPDGTFLDAAALHLMTDASLRTAAGEYPESTWDLRRFRPSVLLEVDGEGYVEDEWVGSTLRVGAVDTTIIMQTIRCGIPGRAQPGLDADGQVVATLKRARRSLLGVYAAVDKPGIVAVGDAVELVEG